MKRSKKSNNPVRSFLKEWALFGLIIGGIILSRIYLWTPVRVDGHSMDPTLADSEYLLVINKLPIDRFDIVVASETENGKTKEIVKRVIGLPGETIEYKNDVLYINGKETDEPYLKDYIQKFKEDKLQSTYSGKGSKKMENSSAKWHRLPKLSPLIEMEVRPSRKSSWMMSIYSLVMIESFQKIAARWGLSKRNKSKGKLSFASGRSFHSRRINP